MTLLILPAAVGSTVNYSLDESESIDITGIEEMEFNLRGVNCALCVRTLDIDTILVIDGPGEEMALTLSEEILSSRERGVPSLILEKERKDISRETLSGPTEFLCGLLERFGSVQSLTASILSGKT